MDIRQNGVLHMIRLLPFEENDFERLISWIDTPAFLLQWAGSIFRYPLDFEQLKRYLAEASGEYSSSKIFKAVNSQEKVVGHIELSNINSNHSSASISRVLVNPAYHGNGIGTSMLRSILEIGFNELNLHRIELRVFDFNSSAIACYKKVGFHIEGLHRDCRRFEEEYWSLYQMSLLQDEWLAIQSRINKQNEKV
jgi:RimJ/RimL family protein N-acetyltransferase